MFLIEYFWKTTKLSDIVGGQGSNDDQFCSAVLRKVALVILYVMFMFILDTPPPKKNQKQTAYFFGPGSSGGWYPREALNRDSPVVEEIIELWA